MPELNEVYTAERPKTRQPLHETLTPLVRKPAKPIAKATAKAKVGTKIEVKKAVKKAAKKPAKKAMKKVVKKAPARSKGRRGLPKLEKKTRRDLLQHIADVRKRIKNYEEVIIPHFEKALRALDLRQQKHVAKEIIPKSPDALAKLGSLSKKGKARIQKKIELLILKEKI